MNLFDISIVVPVFNEVDCLELFLDETIKHIEKCSTSYEIIFIDDGSEDGTYEKLAELSRHNQSIKVLKFARNFGKEAALTAGLKHSAGKAVIPMDVDLQDPPSLIPEMYNLYLEKFDVVLAIRNDRSSDSYLKRKSSEVFYKFFNKISKNKIYENAGDFRLLSRRVVLEILKLNEKTRFMKGIFSWPGFKTTIVTYKREERVKGETKFNYVKLWNFALDGIFSYSDLPLRIWTYIGFIFSAFSFFYMFFMFFRTLFLGVDVPGYASLICLISFIGGLILLSIGIIGEYLARIFIEVKGRPIYVLSEKINL